MSAYCRTPQITLTQHRATLFGRIVDKRWDDTAATPDIDRYQYGYDTAGNRTYRKNPVAAALSAGWHGRVARAGRMKPDPTGLTCTYDAWNRLVKVAQDSTTLAEYEYDAPRQLEEMSPVAPTGGSSSRSGPAR